MSAFKNKLLIEASAGTGKTQALAERLIELLSRVKPQEIVALTFSRAAAGEIFERFVNLLADRAVTDHAAADRLREVIATQHLSQIGTLDSFLMKIVRAFPMELGIAGKLEMMDAYQAKCAQARVAFSILRGTDKTTTRAFVDAFTLAMNHENVRTYMDAYCAFLEKWHERVLAHADESAWGNPERIWGKKPAFVSVTFRELAAAADALETIGTAKPLQEFAAWVRGFRGKASNLKGFADKLFGSKTLFQGATVEFDYNRRHYVYGGEDAAKIRTAMMCVYGYVLHRKLELARGIYHLMKSYEVAYDRRVRRAGYLVFGDIPRLIAELPAATRLALEYRMDARLRAWALDEFQDTSRMQWKALANLIDEAKQSDGEKSVFVVGDRKQAIYGWRDGDVSIFTRERESGHYECEELSKTYRSGPAVVEAVNRVFARGALAAEFRNWFSPEHLTAHPEWDGYVQAFDAPGNDQEAFIEPVAAALKAVDPIGRGLSAAILVRGNDFGELLANGLKARGIAGVVWEGESAILDTPALTPFLDLIQLADHPGDLLAWRHFQMTPLAAAKYPNGVPDAAQVSEEMAFLLTTQGLVRTLRQLRATLPEDPASAWSMFTEERFTDMLRAASAFEHAAEPGTRYADFARFLGAQKKRNLAEPGKIKVMTMHRAKGLGFDYVVLPLYEQKGFTTEPDGPLEGEDWILPDPGGKVAAAVGGLGDAQQSRKDRNEQEALCLYYVAMTRAKRAMTVICHPPASEKSKSSARRFSDIVRETLGTQALGNPAWYTSFAPSKVADAAVASAAELPPLVRGPRRTIRRRLPSLAFHAGQSAGDLFADYSFRRSAVARGTELHARYEQVGWIDPDAPANALERDILASEWRVAFVRPDAAAVLWREHPFELLVGTRWTSGQFDRVVFSGTGATRRAVIYDFKTNRRRAGETEDDFMARLRTGYAGQLAAYRAALASLVDLPADRVEACLLLTDTRSVVRLETV